MFVLAVILGLVTGLAFAASGAAKLVNRPLMSDTRARLDVESPLWNVIGVLEILGGAGLLIGLHSDLVVIGMAAATGLVAMTIGATYYHQRAGDRVVDWLPAVAMGTLCIWYGIARIGAT